MAQAKVGENFKKFLARNATKVEEAKQAENTMKTCSMPVGWKGQAVCVEGEAGTGRDQKDEKGVTIPGRDFITLKFSVINSEEYAGKTFNHIWQFWDTEKATAIDRFEWMLNEMENLGLPRDLRTGYNDVSEIIDFFTNGDAAFDIEVEHNKFRRGDQKEVKIRLPGILDDTTNMTPSDKETDSEGTKEVKEKPKTEASKAAVQKGPQKGDKVKFIDKEWEVVDRDGDDLKIKSKLGSTRNIKITDLD